MKALFQAGDNMLCIDNFEYRNEDAQHGNPYNCSFDLFVQSGLFAGVAPCEYDIKEFRIFFDQLKGLYRFERDSAEFWDICYGSQVRFHMDHTGHIEVTGEIFGEGMEHQLKFRFGGADQTHLPPFIDALETFCQARMR